MTMLDSSTKRTSEQQEWHNRLQKLALAMDDSREYWRNADPSLRPATENQCAYERRWFGARSMHRVRVMMADFRARYARYPSALALLRQWRTMQPESRRLICHWHLQMSDPAYRAFSGIWLPQRQAEQRAVDHAAATRWVQENSPKLWQPATSRQMAQKLLSAAAEAGLVESAPDPRAVLAPRVPDEALGYMLHLLREVDISGGILDNPYLASVGLSGSAVDQRLASLPWVHVARLGGVVQVEWRYESLSAWAEAEL